MGSICFEGWGVHVDDLAALNKSPEVKRLGLVFEQHPGLVSGSAKGNFAACYNILVEVRRRLVSGTFNVVVELSTGDKKDILLSPSYVIENGEDITWLIT